MNIEDKIVGHVNEVPFWRTVIRVFWIAIQIVLILWFGQKGYMFFYQGF